MEKLNPTPAHKGNVKESKMKDKKKKSLGTVLILFVCLCAFVATVVHAVASVIKLAQAPVDPFWVVFGALIWSAYAGGIWLTICLLWEDQL